VKPGEHKLSEDAVLVVPERGPWLVRVKGEREPSPLEESLLRQEIHRRHRLAVTLSRWRKYEATWSSMKWECTVTSALTARRWH
jgi:hypothetical protein